MFVYSGVLLFFYLGFVAGASPSSCGVCKVMESVLNPFLAHQRFESERDVWAGVCARLLRWKGC